jgi:hypothetical protein
VRSAALPILLVFSLSGAGCLSEDVCSPHQRVDEALRCSCIEGTIPPASGTGDCIPCGEHEHVSAAACVCDEGYARASAGEACTLIPSGLGVACSATQTCVDAEYHLCHGVGDGAGYCTTTCGTGGECPAGYTCTADGSSSYCRRPPTGLGETCQSSADCSGYEASFCETFVSHVCLVQGCTLGGSDCYAGASCCDLSRFGMPTLCVPTGQCPVQ